MHFAAKEEIWKFYAVLLLTLVASLLIRVIKQPDILLLIYLTVIIAIMYIYFDESIKKIVVCSVWITLVVQILYMIFVSIIEIVEYVMGKKNDSIGNLVASLLTCALIYIR